MNKKCLTCNLEYKAKTTTSKYCSRQCQYESYRKEKVKRIPKKCLNCEIEFLVKPNDIELNRGKYCSRICKDVHQKQKYIGVNNPMYGKKISSETKEKKSKKMIEIWKNENYRIKVKKSFDEFVKKNGYYPGSDNESRQKRKITMLNKYGVEHNWNGKYGSRICDVTTLEKYGKTSVELLMDYESSFGKETDIEKIFKNLLDQLKIPYQYKYRIYTKNKKPFWFREFDFLIEDSNILIEVDGDYWHGNEKTVGTLNEYQLNTRKKDAIKEDFAIKNGYIVVRFWGSDVKNNQESVKLEIDKIIKNEKNKIKKTN